MSGRDRNAPCPCGSGKKYKKCCLSKTEGAPRYLPTDEQELRKWLEGLPESDEALHLLFEDVPDEVFEDEIAGPIARGHLTAYMVVEILGDANHPLHAELSARVQDHEPPAGEQAYLKQAASAILRPFELVEIHRGHGATLRDVLTDEVIRVYHPPFGNPEMEGETMMIRLVPRGPSGEAEPILPWLPFPRPAVETDENGEELADDTNWYIDELREAWAAHRESNPDAGIAALLDAFLRAEVPGAFRSWYEALRGLPAGDMQTPDGHPIEDVDVVFEVPDAAALAAALDARADLKRTGDDWEWLRPIKRAGDASTEPGAESTEGGELTALAWLRLESDRLLVQCIARAHAEQLRATFEAELAPHVRFLEIVGVEDEADFDASGHTDEA